MKPKDHDHPLLAGCSIINNTTSMSARGTWAKKLFCADILWLYYCSGQGSEDLLSIFIYVSGETFC